MAAGARPRDKETVMPEQRSQQSRALWLLHGGFQGARSAFLGFAPTPWVARRARSLQLGDLLSKLTDLGSELLHRAVATGAGQQDRPREATRVCAGSGRPKSTPRQAARARCGTPRMRKPARPQPAKAEAAAAQGPKMAP